MDRETSSSNRGKFILPVALALIIGLAAGTTAGIQITHGAPNVSFALAPVLHSTAPPVLPTTGFAPIVKMAMPAVVNINSSKVVKVRDNMPNDPFLNDPFFQQFFGPQSRQFNQPQEQHEHSLGSGVIVNKDGYILTNNHVIEGATQISVELSDRRQFKAKVIGTDPQSDLAILKIDASNLPTLPLADSNKLQIGDYVLAIGDPFGIGETVTMGIVSAMGRTNVGIEGKGAYEDFIQTDAAINPGNSGGALIDAEGNLVGINTAIASSSGGNEGIGFAIPIDMARSVMTQIVEHGKVSRGYLGVEIEQVTPALAKQFGLANAEGALVADVTPDSPASKAGLRRGDVIIGLNGQTMADFSELRLRIAESAPNTTVNLKVVRDGKQIDISVMLGELAAAPQSASNESTSSTHGPMSGVQVENLTPSIAHQLGIGLTVHGVVITQVSPDSLAAQVGLQPGDVIEEVNRHAVNSVQDYQQALAHGKSDSALLLVNRNGETTYFAVQSE
ncbi:MAG TPA: DegQ family serine endoprotease [Candidatus Acidoferrum sp.]|nr:DegQ family serine endoprotease [Candidatus Acidoferrum sp.]